MSSLLLYLTGFLLLFWYSLFCQEVTHSQRYFMPGKFHSTLYRRLGFILYFECAFLLWIINYWNYLSKIHTEILYFQTDNDHMHWTASPENCQQTIILVFRKQLSHCVMLQSPLNISVDRLMDSFLFFILNQVFPLSSLEMEFGMSGMLTCNFTEPLFFL